MRKCGGPGVDDGGRRNLAEHLADGGDQMTADDRIVLGANAHRAVPHGGMPQGARKHGRIVDEGRVCVDRMCERARLGARALVRHVEELLELRIVGEEARVEVSEQRLAVGGEDGSSCLDNGLLLVVSMVWVPSLCCFS